ncbi:MAG: 30S ribosomal protein S17 [Phycisphaerales bacterium JB043]
MTTTEHQKGVRIGVVDSDKRDKTRRVVIRYKTKHPKYGKYIQKRTILHVHDENNDSRLGDRVEVVPSRPRSKTKQWELVRVVERAIQD